MTAGNNWLRLFVVAASAASAQTSAVEGSAVHSRTGAPVENVRVILQPLPDAKTKPYGAITGADGKFAWSAVEPGRYILTTSARGFIGASQQVTTSPNGTLSIDLKMTPTASITGRVLDDNGDPVENVRMAIEGSFSDAETDERGEFRIGELLQGQYLLRAIPRPMPLPPEIRTDGSKEQAYQPTYYPNSPRKEGATRVEVRDAVDTTGVEIHLAPMPILRVSGTVRGIPPESDSIRVSFRRLDGVNVPQAIVRKGAFAAWRVPPGKYTLDIDCQARDGRHFANFPHEIDLANENIDGLELDLLPEFDLAGEIQWASTPLATNAAKAPSIRLRSIVFVSSRCRDSGRARSQRTKRFAFPKS